MRVDEELGGTYPPGLYDPDRTAPLFSVEEAAAGGARAYYEEHGFVAVADLLGRSEVQAAIDAIGDLLSGRNPAFNDIYLERAAAKDGGSLQAELDKARKLWRFVGYDPRLKALSEHDYVRAIVRGLMSGKEPQLFQDMALLKPPHIGREKPWHQDHAYFDLPLETPVVGVWIALDPATIANGCMQFVDGGQRKGPMSHWRRRDWQICDADVLGTRSVACPLSPGGAVFFSSLVPHGTPQNNSEERRRALQFHYCAAEAKAAAPEERLRIFGTEGKDVSC
jgi:phytanoyl-CoA hydroxylase